jgi:hypothetical protein
VTNYATSSERFFAEYLDARGLTFEYEPSQETGRRGRNPDFLVHVPTGDVSFEVTELTWLPEPKEPTGEFQPHAGFDGYAPIRRRLQEKHKQGRHLKGKMPYVVVLWFVPPHPVAEFVVPGAMFGNVAISIPVDPAGGPPPDRPARNIFTKGGRLQPKRLTTVSAVAVLNARNPTVADVESRIDERLSDDADGAEIAEVVHEEYGRPDYDASAYVLGLDTFHNIFAAAPRLPRGTFAGPRDREFDALGPEYGEVFRGTDA